MDLEHKEFDICFRCPHCKKLSTATVHIRTDNESVLAAFELLSKFEMKGKKEEEGEQNE